MTIRVGANPAADQMYVGLQSGATLSNRVASGTLSLRLTVGGTSQRRLFGSGTLPIVPPTLTLVPVHPVRRRGPGSLGLGNLTATANATLFGRIDGSGTLTLVPSIRGTALHHRLASGDLALGFRIVGIGELQGSGQRIASGDLQFVPLVTGDATVHAWVPASGDLTLTLALAAAGLRHAYITGTGEITLGRLSVSEVGPAQAPQVIPMQGLFMDGYLEGAFVESMPIEGAV